MCNYRVRSGSLKISKSTIRKKQAVSRYVIPQTNVFCYFESIFSTRCRFFSVFVVAREFVEHSVTDKPLYKRIHCNDRDYLGHHIFNFIKQKLLKSQKSQITNFMHKI